MMMLGHAATTKQIGLAIITTTCIETHHHLDGRLFECCCTGDDFSQFSRDLALSGPVELTMQGTAELLGILRRSLHRDHSHDVLAD